MLRMELEKKTKTRRTYCKKIDGFKGEILLVLGNKSKGPTYDSWQRHF